MIFRWNTVVGITARVASGLIKLAFSLERFSPQFVKFFLNRKLKEYKKKDAITSYKVKAGRKGKYHYLFEVDLSTPPPSRD